MDTRGERTNQTPAYRPAPLMSANIASGLKTNSAPAAYPHRRSTPVEDCSPFLILHSSLLPVAGRTACEYVASEHIIFAFELPSQLELVRWHLVGHIKDLASRTEILLRCAVALNAPFHLQRCDLRDERH